jgi:Dolichyl-phosphate-mannose-protein mannosyltransferase
VNEPNVDRTFDLRKIAILVLIITLALLIRGLTANFIAARFDDPGWFQSGSFAIFDRQAQDVLDGRESVFWIPDRSRTDLIQYPPGNRVWIGGIYALTGERSAASVQRVQWMLDAFSVLLIVGIAVTSYGWTVGLTAGVLAALSPLLSLYAAVPGADAPTSWFILAAVWFLLLAARRDSLVFAIGAGVFLGVSCWLRVNPLLLFVSWGIALMLFFRGTKRHRVRLALAMGASSLIIVAPLVIRNLIVFYPEVAPTGLNIGWNLLAGIGETDRGAEFGVPCCDAKVIEQERLEMGLPPDAPLGLVYPDGIRRDRERGRRALAIIKDHPVWYAGVVVRRALGHLKLAGKPAPSLGSAGLNVTSSKCLPVHRQVFPLSTAVNVLGMIQSVLRYIALPFMLIGILVGLRTDFRITALILSTVVYFLVTLAVGHSEIRYGLPMQALLVIFYALGICALWMRISSLRKRRSFKSLKAN